MPIRGDFAIITASQGAWLSWLERTVHIREVVGSSPSAPTRNTSAMECFFDSFEDSWGNSCIRVPYEVPKRRGNTLTMDCFFDSDSVSLEEYEEGRGAFVSNESYFRSFIQYINQNYLFPPYVLGEMHSM